MSDQVYLSSRDFAARYGKERGNFSMWLARRTAADPRFPRPIRIGHRKFFKLADIEEYERTLAADPSTRMNAA